MLKFWNDIEVQIIEKNELKKENIHLRSLIPEEKLNSKKKKQKSKKSSILKYFKKSLKKKKKLDCSDFMANELPHKLKDFRDYADLDLNKFRKTAEIVFRQSYRQDLPTNFFHTSEFGKI